MKTILIVGQKFSTLTEYLKKHGFDYIFLQDINKTKFPEKKIKRRVLGDFSNDETLLKTMDSINTPIDGVIATYENYILPAAKIAQHLNLPGLPIKTAEACTDKYLMRSLFTKSSEKISPDFAEINSKYELLAFAKQHSYPLIIKPANLSKSLLVTKSNNLGELILNYERTVGQIDKIYAKYAPGREPKLIIEEYLDGTIHSVDAFIGNDGEPQILENIVDYQTGYDIGFDDNFHYSRLLPSKLSPADQTALRHCATVGIKALGMKNSPAHVEIIMTTTGPRIVEIGARNGGYRERMHKLANGIDITGAALALALGKQPAIKSTKNNPCAVFELFPKKPGIFINIKNEKKLKKLSSFNYMSIKAKNGAFVGKSSDGYKMVAVVILFNQNIKQFENDLDFINNYVYVETN